MEKEKLLAAWKAEEEIAQIHGWDFSHIEGKYMEQEDLPWSYREVIERWRKPEMKLLDIDTGGGEFLLFLGYPYENTAATEGYAPNVELCRETLLPLGIDFRPGCVRDKLPFADESFDLILNRHGDFDAEDLYRMLKPGGIVVTQQVGAENDRELVQLLCGETPLPFPEQTLEVAAGKFRAAGFALLEEQECFRPIRFFDVGALVWFARIIQWEFPDFSVDRCLDRLYEAQELLERTGVIEGSIHRFLLAAKKPEKEGCV